MAANEDVPRTTVDTLRVQIKALDEKFTLWFIETNKRNEQRFDAQQEAVTAALASAEKAVVKAEIASERRFEGMNEFRQSLSDQTNTYMPRAEYTVQHKAVTDKVDLGFDRISTIEKKIGDMAARGTGRTDVWMVITTVASLLIALVSLFFLSKGGIKP